MFYYFKDKHRLSEVKLEFKGQNCMFNSYEMELYSELTQQLLSHFLVLDKYLNMLLTTHKCILRLHLCSFRNYVKMSQNLKCNFSSQNCLYGNFSHIASCIHFCNYRLGTFLTLHVCCFHCIFVHFFVCKIDADRVE